MIGISGLGRQSSLYKKRCLYDSWGYWSNEYENNVNNDWYTNTMAAWTLEYTLEVIAYLRQIKKIQSVYYQVSKEEENK